MIVVLVRTIILYIAVLIALRVMGKGELSEMNPFELVITLMIAEVAAFPMEDNKVPITYGIAAITGLMFIQMIVSYISVKSTKGREIISGKPTILIRKGKLDEKAMRKERLGIDELLEQLRLQGYFNLREVQYAILETDGDLSVVPAPELHSEDEDQSKDFKHLPIMLVLDGKVLKENLKMINKDEHWILNELKKKGINDFKSTFICILDEDDNIYAQIKQKEG
jgi:uncharacterized membrane protein YcaP (DUF421 family)